MFCDDMKIIDAYFSHGTTSPQHRRVSITCVFTYCWQRKMNWRSRDTSNIITSKWRLSHNSHGYLLLRQENSSRHTCKIKSYHVSKEAFLEYFCSCILKAKHESTQWTHQTTLHEYRSVLIIRVFMYCWDMKMNRHTLLKSNNLTSTQKYF